MPTEWKPGRGKMGFMAPLIGTWKTEIADTPLGPVVCMRTYEKTLDGKWIELTADWDIGGGKKHYVERAFYGVGRDKVPAFWSFTSDGGQSHGILADVGEMAEGAKGFEAEMTAGLARFGFWPTEGGMMWAADAKTKKGWREIVRHPCVRV